MWKVFRIFDIIWYPCIGSPFKNSKTTTSSSPFIMWFSTSRAALPSTKTPVKGAWVKVSFLKSNTPNRKKDGVAQSKFNGQPWQCSFLGLPQTKLLRSRESHTAPQASFNTAKTNTPDSSVGAMRLAPFPHLQITRAGCSLPPTIKFKRCLTSCLTYMLSIHV